MKDFKPKQFSNNKKTLTVFRGLCKGCGLCIEKCPLKALAFSKENLGVYYSPAIEVDLEKCNACGICETTCPDNALKVNKQKND